MNQDEKFVEINNAVEELKIYTQHYINKHTEEWSEIKDIWVTLRQISNLIDAINMKSDE